MQRREATLLLLEINGFPEVTPFTCIYLKSHGRTCASEDLDLHIKTSRDPSTREIIQRIARKHNFLTKDEPGGFLVIHEREMKPLEIMA